MILLINFPTPSITSDHVTHGGRDIRHYYAHDKDIHVPGTVYLKGKLQAKNSLKIGALYPSKPVFKYNVTEMVHDTVFRYETDVKVTGQKIFRDKLQIGNLKSGGKFSNLSKVPLDGMVRIKIDGNLVAPVIKCSHVHVHQEINGMPAEQFGHQWLSTEGDQIFSQRQTFHNFNAEKLLLYGHLEENGVKYDINNAVKNTYSTNRREVVLPKTVFGEKRDIMLLKGKVIRSFIFCRRSTEREGKYATLGKGKQITDPRGSVNEQCHPDQRTTRQRRGCPCPGGIDRQWIVEQCYTVASVRLHFERESIHGGQFEGPR